MLDETDSAPEEDYDYTCPEQTTGHFYRSPTRVSLVDTKAQTVLSENSVSELARSRSGRVRYSLSNSLRLLL